MVLDLDLFRVEKGGNPDKIRENEKRRFKDVALVETVLNNDILWRQLRHKADNWNKLKNVCSKEIGEKMKKKEPQGDPDTAVQSEVQEQLTNLTSDILKPLTVAQKLSENPVINSNSKHINIKEHFIRNVVQEETELV
ncbi:Seryl-tRNA synthetase N-terminal domain [Popillia japonica]|uniref:Seryl-tRNA synthetase N-terminal domain n=1 Tax=Popillia japonica TaxID=7064 RepID=A0AAW1LL98_POPJA